MEVLRACAEEKSWRVRYMMVGRPQTGIYAYARRPEDVSPKFWSMSGLF